MKKPFAIWKVKDKEYKLKLKTSAVCKLEEQLKCNLLSLLDKGIPPISTMLLITHAAMKDWEHGIKFNDVQDKFDEYCEDGGSQIDFFTDVFMEIYTVSGFFSEAQVESVTEKIEEAKEQM